MIAIKCDTFNSLLEMLNAARLLRLLHARLPFNSLFEMPNWPNGDKRVAHDSLSILYLRCRFASCATVASSMRNSFQFSI